MNSVPQNHAGIASGVNNARARTAGLLAIALLGIVMLDVFKNQLDRHLQGSKLPPAIGESVRAQSTKLAAIALPKNQDAATEQSIRRAIDDSFISGFRVVMLIGAILAAAGAITALALIGNPDKS